MSQLLQMSNHTFIEFCCYLETISKKSEAQATLGCFAAVVGPFALFEKEKNVNMDKDLLCEVEKLNVK